MSDSDNDEFSDGEEIANGFDPNNGLSNPSMNIITIIVIISVISIAIVIISYLIYPRIRTTIVAKRKMKDLEREKIEIRVGIVKLLYIMSRIAPKFASKKVNS